MTTYHQRAFNTIVRSYKCPYRWYMTSKGKSLNWSMIATLLCLHVDLDLYFLIILTAILFTDEFKHRITNVCYPVSTCFVRQCTLTSSGILGLSRMPVIVVGLVLPCTISPAKLALTRVVQSDPGRLFTEKSNKYYCLERVIRYHTI